MSKKFKKYQRKDLSEMRPILKGELKDYEKDGYIMVDIGDTYLIEVSISAEDHPKLGDMIARTPDNHRDQWLVSKEYFEKNFVELTEAKKATTVDNKAILHQLRKQHLSGGYPEEKKIESEFGGRRFVAHLSVATTKLDYIDRVYSGFSQGVQEKFYPVYNLALIDAKKLYDVVTEKDDYDNEKACGLQLCLDAATKYFKEFTTDGSRTYPNLPDEDEKKRKSVLSVDEQTGMPPYCPDNQGTTKTTFLTTKSFQNHDPSIERHSELKVRCVQMATAIPGSLSSPGAAKDLIEVATAIYNFVR